ncbi:MAG: hypothetical protein ETSY1_35075 [Candidatus Entotheonella factor]|uniref:Response regulatory domain-containing protein n=1 Tax=Entotheonella factor TaxID=1429438 RepID=W4LAQ9_ENTF1|nr:response regulator [Candidatus Entotheonella palauensis]ETW94396.1 MAG: hypothetical protein ETSY1_35075 [Candidatus Entotheonella factor]
MTVTQTVFATLPYPDTNALIEAPVLTHQTVKDKILVLEDEDFLRNMFQMMLERFGYEAVCVREGSEVAAAYEVASHLGIPFTALLLDVNNRFGMGAEETMACLLNLDPNVKAIVCSADYHHPVMKNYKAYGFTAKLEKPFSRKELIATLDQIKHPCG